MPDDASLDEVIDAIIKTIGEGCKQAGDHGSHYCRLSAEAMAFVRRRYKGSIEEKLRNNAAGDWKNKHKMEIDKVAFAHGQMAGAIWRYYMVARPAPPAEVTVEMLAKAGQIMEIECQSFLQEVAAARGASMRLFGGYCW